MSLVNQYPYTNFHDVNLDYILKLVRENAGLHLEIVGNKLVMKTADNSIVSSVTISYAETADQANTATQANYAATAGVAATAQHASTADTATSATTASEAVHAASADTATTATSAVNATNAINATYAASAGSATNATNAAYAETTGNVEKAGNGLKQMYSLNGSLTIKMEDDSFLTTQLDAKTSEKATKDGSNNTITSTYIASVVDDNGVLKFKNANGTTLFSITPSSQTATEDSYGNTIADFVKAITAPSDSNYVTVQHGTGTTETLTINYSNAAWKDTNGNVIKNFYAGSMEIVEDGDTGHYNLVVYNGDTPKAELYRFEILAYKAQEAEEADHAAAADYATEAGHATTADSATTAETAATCNTSKIIQAEIKPTDTSPLNLTVGQSFDYETDIDSSTFIYWILQGKTVMVRFHDEDDNSQGCYLLQSGSPVIMSAYEMGVGPAYFQVTNNSTYTNGLKLIRM